MTRKEAADLLGISISTLQRRTKAGQYQSVRNGTGQFAAVTYTHTGIGLPEPQPEIVIDANYEDANPEPKPQPVVVVPPKPEPSSVDRKLEQDAEFAAKYLAGEATDSSGNRVDGRNDMFPSKGTQSLLGPVPRQEPAKPPSGASHMDPALTGSGADRLSNPQLGSGFTRHGIKLAAGLSQEAYDAMMHQWQGAGGKRSMSEQEEANRRSLTAIHRAFPEADRT